MVNIDIGHCKVLERSLSGCLRCEKIPSDPVDFNFRRLALGPSALINSDMCDFENLNVALPDSLAANVVYSLDGSVSREAERKRRRGRTTLRDLQDAMFFLGWSELER